ncbi:unnamed protein product [Penicillium viridicatum]
MTAMLCLNFELGPLRAELALTARDAALAESERVLREVCELQQQLESTNAALQDQVPWNDIQLVLDQARGDLVSTAPHEFSNCSKFANFAESNRIRTLVSVLRIYGRFDSSKFANLEQEKGFVERVFEMPGPYKNTSANKV